MAEIFNVLTLDSDKRLNITATDTYQDIGNVTMANPNVIDGTYEFGMSITTTFNVTAKSIFFRFSTDGGSTWTEFRREPKDSTDSEPLYYAFPKVIDTSTAINMITQIRKEDITGVLTVEFSDVWIKRIG